MNELIAVLATAALFAGFGLLRRFAPCPDPASCASRGGRGCGACTRPGGDR